MDLFSTFRLGTLELPNRVVMAPMTRSRALGGIPNELIRDYYAQRASAGLIVTEGTSPSPNGLGYARIPGLFSAEQVQGWRRVTDAVHARGGRIFAQLMHVGRIAHPRNLPPGGRVLAPSAVQPAGTMWTDQEGIQPFPEPEAMTLEEVRQARNEFVQAARNAIEAGFDGVELHGANGYLIEQFLHPHTNRRTDEYGGSMAKRERFVVETARASADAIGAERLGVRLSPYGTFNDLPAHDEVHEQYTALAASLGGLAYLHIVGNPHESLARTAKAMRERFGGPIIRNGGLDRTSAQEVLNTDGGDLISFGRPFIANPDLVTRMQTGAALADLDPQTLYTPDARGYVDYPALAEQKMIPLSILELGRVRQGGDRRAALDEARDLARHAEGLGYRRFWVAEHHNTPTVTTAATSLVIAHIAAGTTTIRVGSGGIMLPNHAPYVIAEQFGTLATLFPGRIDLGLGRAPGTDQLTLRALRRTPAAAEHFPDDVLELQAFLGPVRPGQPIEAVPGSGTEVPLWILGSSLFGAQLAAQLGLPYGFASHFAPDALDPALRIYRERFQPSAQQETPYALVGVNVIAAETDDEAHHLATSQQMSFADFLRGRRSVMQPPIDDIESYWTPQEKAVAGQMLALSIIGGPATVRRGLDALIARTRADELMIVSDLYDPALRRRSFQIIADSVRTA